MLNFKKNIFSQEPKTTQSKLKRNDMTLGPKKALLKMKTSHLGIMTARYRGLASGKPVSRGRGKTAI